MEKIRVVSISYGNQSTKEVLTWIHQIIAKVLIEKLQLDAKSAGDFLMTSNQFLRMIQSLKEDDAND